LVGDKYLAPRPPYEASIENDHPRERPKPDFPDLLALRNASRDPVLDEPIHVESIPGWSQLNNPILQS
jgi:hypothetical protein